MSNTTTTKTTGSTADAVGVVSGPYTNRSNANRGLKRYVELMHKDDTRHVKVERRLTDGGETEQFVVVAALADATPAMVDGVVKASAEKFDAERARIRDEAPEVGTAALDLPVSDRIAAGLAGNLALDDEGVLRVAEAAVEQAPAPVKRTRKAAAPKAPVEPAETPESVDSDDAHLTPLGAEEPGKRVRCGAGTVAYTHRVKVGSRFEFGRWVADNGDVVTFAKGHGYRKNGVAVEAKTLAGAFEA